MTKTYRDLLAEARARVREVTTAEAELAAEHGATLIDCREDSEWEQGHVAGAVHLSKSYIEQDIEGLVPDRSSSVVVYCAGGIRSLFAAETLVDMGYSDVVSMSGGYQAWKAEGRAWEQPRVLTAEQRLRYSRHLLIPEVGAEGQARLLDSKVLFVGAGGLGSPALLYMAAAGVGTLGIVDFDVVDSSNLQRQIIHRSDRVGMRKVESAQLTINDLNPDIEVVTHEVMLGPDNVADLISGYDLIFDGTDTFETRYVLNDAAVQAGIPVVHASVFRFEGQLTVFKPHAGPCYRCLYPTPPPPELAPGCSVAGVLGVVPGVMGLLQATEGLKVLLDVGDSLAGRLLIYDALDGAFSELQLQRDPKCPACGEGESPQPAADEGVFALPTKPAATTGVNA